MSNWALMNRIFWATAISSVLGACAAEPVEMTPRWLTTIEKCQVWDPRPLVGEVATWSGACVGGYTEGQGKLVWKSPHPPIEGSVPASDLKITSIYNGQMRHGFEQGHGSDERFDVNTGESRSIISGTYENSLLEGSGVTSYPDGMRSTGYFHLGRREGYGLIEYSDGQRYEGNFHDGKEEGHGRLTSRNAFYEGDFHQGLPNGLGKYVLVGSGTIENPQVVLDGSWRNGCLIDETRNVCFIRR